MSEGHPYFATVVVIGDGDAAAFRREAGRVLAGQSGARGAIAILARGGVMVRVLASSAPALLAVVDDVWAAARQTLVGLPPLALRRL